jgi:hypothetical protein
MVQVRSMYHRLRLFVVLLSPKSVLTIVDKSTDKLV